MLSNVGITANFHNQMPQHYSIRIIPTGGHLESHAAGEPHSNVNKTSLFQIQPFLGNNTRELSEEVTKDGKGLTELPRTARSGQ